DRAARCSAGGPPEAGCRGEGRGGHQAYAGRGGRGEPGNRCGAGRRDKGQAVRDALASGGGWVGPDRREERGASRAAATGTRGVGWCRGTSAPERRTVPGGEREV